MRKALNHLRKADPVMAAIIDRVGGYKLTRMQADFHGLTRSIVYQQLSGKAAATIFGRLVAAAGDPLTPAGVLALTPEQLRGLGLSKQKASYVVDLAARTQSGEVRFDLLTELPDEEVIAMLTRVKGVGEWTAHMYLMFALMRPNVLPTGDLGIRNAVQKAYRLRKPPKAADIQRIARNWHPWCSIASWYLWRSLEVAAPAKPAAVKRPAARSARAG